MIKDLHLDPFDPATPIEEGALELVRQQKFGDELEARKFLKRVRAGNPIGERTVTLPDGSVVRVVP